MQFDRNQGFAETNVGHVDSDEPHDFRSSAFIVVHLYGVRLRRDVGGGAGGSGEDRQEVELRPLGMNYPEIR